MKSLSLIVLMSFAGLSNAWATTPEYIELIPKPRLELNVAGGMARPSGYLTSEESTGSYIVGINMGAGSGLMTFEWNGFTAKHDTGEFPLANNRDVRVSAFSFIPQIRVFEKESWDVFLGFGLTQVSLSQTDPDYFTSFGSFILHSMLRYQLSDKWSVHLKSQWYEVQQKLNGQETKFAIWNNAAGIGYNFF